MKVEKGEYLRLDNGYIYKYESNGYEWIKEEDGQLVYGNGSNEYEWESDIVNHSFNIIDLIEVGDYVNGSKVIDIAQAPKRAVYIEDIQQHLALIPITNINRVVTKEQFESMEYKI